MKKLASLLMVTWMDTLPYKGALECNLYESNVGFGSAHHCNGPMVSWIRANWQCSRKGMLASHEYQLRIEIFPLQSRDHTKISLLEKATKLQSANWDSGTSHIGQTAFGLKHHRAWPMSISYSTIFLTGTASQTNTSKLCQLATGRGQRTTLWSIRKSEAHQGGETWTGGASGWQ